MIRFKQFLAEESAHIELDDAIGLIKKNCQPFLKEAQRNLVYRGMREGLGRRYTIEVPHPENRLPRNSDVAFNVAYNFQIAAAYGIQNIRQHSIFTHGNKSTVTAYGEPYYFFPKGHIKYLWGPLIGDSWMQENACFEVAMERILQDVKIPLSDSRVMWAQQSYRNLCFQVKSGNYSDLIAPGWKEKIAKSFRDDLSGYAEKIPKDMQDVLINALKVGGQATFIDSKMLSKVAAESKREILFYQTDGYYMVPCHLIKKDDLINELYKDGSSE
jgi:hypothetical protein